MKDFVSGLLTLGLIGSVLGVVVWWQVYEYHECKNVGHSTLHCVAKIMR